MKKLIIAVSVFQLMYGGFIKNIEAKEMSRKIEMMMVNSKKKAQEEVLQILTEPDKEKRNEKVEEKVSRLYKSLRRFQRRVERKSNDELMDEVNKIILKASGRGYEVKKINLFKSMKEDISSGVFRDKLSENLTLENENKFANLLKDKLNSTENLSMINKNLFIERLPANLEDWAIDYVFGGKTDLTGIPLVDILLGLVLWPTLLSAFAMVFGLVGIGMMLYGVLYCAPKWLLTGRGC